MASNLPSSKRMPFEALQVDVESSEIELASPSTRRPYRRQPSWNGSNAAYRAVEPQDQDIAEMSEHSQEPPAEGLGLHNIHDQSPPKVKRVPVGSKEVSAGISFPVSPSRTPELHQASVSQSTTAQNTPFHGDDEHLSDHWPSPYAPRYSLKDSDQRYHHVPAATHLLDRPQPAFEGCPTSGDVLKSRWGWYSTVVILLALFSTIFSAIFLGIALRKPRWGGLKSMPIETATLVSALFSKLIELTFACVFVATLGQILSRRAFAKNHGLGSPGVSIAEINMRLWILQPGTLLTHWTGAWFALRTFLGLIALLAAIAAALYITAAEALVSPKLAFGKNETRVLTGAVSTIYANMAYLNAKCETPIIKTLDPKDDEEGPACMQVKHAGQGFRNFEAWNTMWAEKIAGRYTSESRDWRPPPVAMIADNTTVKGQWISPNHENVTRDSTLAGRLVHSVSLAMPHANVVRALREQQNNILQPEDLGGSGEYYVQAAVPAPALNVLCVGATEEDLQPMLVTNLTDNTPTVWPFKTSLDNIFGFTQNRTEEPGDYSPWFLRLPKEHNILVNNSGPYGQGALYLLAAPPKAFNTSEYMLCALKSSIYPNCTTSYHVALAGSELSVHCADSVQNDPGNVLPYSDAEPNAPVWVRNQDWPSIGTSWANAVGLSQGVTDANASIARYLTEMSPRYTQGRPTMLNDSYPTLTEGLAVLAGSTLLIASDKSPFIHAWNYTEGVSFDDADVKHQYFHALVSYKDYTSGNGAPWQGLFYIVLIVVFFLNLFCLVYLLWKFYHDGEVTDYTEPQNLFALAINSPPSHSMSGSCGPGPSGEMLRKKWTVDISHLPSSTMTTPALGHGDRYAAHGPASGGTSHPHFYVHCHDDDVAMHMRNHLGPDIGSPGHAPYTQMSPGVALNSHFVAGGASRSRLAFPSFGFRFRPISLNLVNWFWKKRQQARIRPTSMNDLQGDDLLTVEESPAVQQYMRLSGRQ